MDRSVSGRASIGLLAVLAPAYLWLFVWSEPTNNPNENVRVYAVRALAEHGTYAIGRRDRTTGQNVDTGPIYERWGWVNDKAIRCDEPGRKGPDCSGWLYQGKAPGLQFLGTPPAAVLRLGYRLLGWGVPSKAAWVWWLRLTVVIVPTLLAWLLLARHLARRLDDPQLGVAVVLAGALGSLSLTYGQMFAGHQPGGLALLAGWLLVVRAGQAAAPVAMMAAGCALGWAPAIEYPMGPAAVLLAGWVLLRRRRALDLVWLALGAALPVALTAHYHAVAFGKPWTLPYAFLENIGFQRDIAPGFMGIHWPDKEKVVGSLLSPYTGLWFFAPWTALIFLAGAALARRRAREPAATLATLDVRADLGLAADTSAEPAPRFWAGRRGEALTALLLCIYFIWFQCSHSLWRGGWVVGPRYITALVPFAVIAAAHGLDALPAPRRLVWLPLFGGLACASIAVTGLCSAVSQGFPFEVYNPLPEVVGPLLSHGWVGNNVLMARGVPSLWSAAPYFAALGAGAGWLLYALARSAAGARGSVAAAAIGLAATLVALQWNVGPGRTDASQRTAAWLTEGWTPRHPPGAQPLLP